MGGVHARVDYVPLVVPEGTPVVGLDPGRKDLYTTSTGSGFDRFGDTSSLSVVAWREKIGLNHATKLRQSWIKKSDLNGAHIGTFIKGKLTFFR